MVVVMRCMPSSAGSAVIDLIVFLGLIIHPLFFNRFWNTLDGKNRQTLSHNISLCPNIVVIHEALR